MVGATAALARFAAEATYARIPEAARAGVSGALLAAKGYWADDAVLEGRYGLFNAVHGVGNYDLGRVEDGLGQQWAIANPGLTIKRYPACGGVLRAVDAVLALREQHVIS